MNKIFKVIWSKTQGCFVVVSEMASSVGGKKCAVDSSSGSVGAIKNLTAFFVPATLALCCAEAMANVDVGTNVKVGQNIKTHSSESSVALGSNVCVGPQSGGHAQGIAIGWGG